MPNLYLGWRMTEFIGCHLRFPSGSILVVLVTMKRSFLVKTLSGFNCFGLFGVKWMIFDWSFSIIWFKGHGFPIQVELSRFQFKFGFEDGWWSSNGSAWLKTHWKSDLNRSLKTRAWSLGSKSYFGWRPILVEIETVLIGSQRQLMRIEAWEGDRKDGADVTYKKRQCPAVRIHFSWIIAPPQIQSVLLVLLGQKSSLTIHGNCPR